MDKNLLIEIFVPTKEGPDIGIKATGYPVGPGRILTARHVLFPGDRDETKPIEARWYHQTGINAEFRAITKIAWHEDRFDVALIDCEFPEGLSGYGMLSAEKPADGMRWASEGFARAGRKEGSRNAVPMIGDLHSAADKEDTFHLGVKYHVSLEQGWRGASGSPIFVDNKIIGVVISCPENFDQARLSATPMWKLLQIPEFRRAIGYDDREKRLAAIKGKLAAALRRSPVAMDALDEDRRTQHHSAEARAEKLASIILDLRIEQVLRRTKKAYKALIEADQTAAAAAVRDAANLIVPAVFDEGVVEAVRARKSDVGAALFALPATTRTVAEIIMAGVDRRPASFKASSEEESWPEGLLVLPMPPEAGLKGMGEPFKENFHAHLRDKFVDKRDRDRRVPEALIQHISNRLKRAAEEDQQTWYCVFELDASAREDCEAAFRELKRLYPSIVFIELSRNDDIWVRETDLFDPLRYMLLSGAKQT